MSAYSDLVTIYESNSSRVRAAWSTHSNTSAGTASYREYVSLFDERSYAYSAKTDWEKLAERDNNNPYQTIDGKTVFVGGAPDRQKAREMEEIEAKYDGLIAAIERAHPEYIKKRKDEEKAKEDEQNKEYAEKANKFELPKTILAFIIAVAILLDVTLDFVYWEAVVFAIGYFAVLCGVLYNSRNPYLTKKYIYTRIVLYVVMLIICVGLFVLHLFGKM